jgi:hypothetical protein
VKRVAVLGLLMVLGLGAMAQMPLVQDLNWGLCAAGVHHRRGLQRRWLG